MRYLIELVMSGLVIGAIYGLIAMAFSVIYKATGIVNFAQGEVCMLIAYLSWSFGTTFGTSGFGVIAFAVVAGVVLGLLIERLVMRPMLGEPVFSVVLVTIGLAVVLRSLVLLIWGASPHKLDVDAADAVRAAEGFALARDTRAPVHDRSDLQFRHSVMIEEHRRRSTIGGSFLNHEGHLRHLRG